jgi:hypothetical protein
VILRIADILLYAADITECNEVPAPIENVPGADNLASGITEWVEILMNEMMASSSNPDEAKARVSRVLEAFHKSSISGIHTEAMQRFQKVVEYTSQSTSELTCLLPIQPSILLWILRFYPCPLFWQAIHVCAGTLVLVDAWKLCKSVEGQFLNIQKYWQLMVCVHDIQ